MNGLGKCIAILTETTEKVNEAVSIYSAAVDPTDTEDSVRRSLKDALDALAERTSRLTDVRNEMMRRWDAFDLFIPVIVGLGVARLRVACNKPCGRIENPWTTQSVYESLKKKLGVRPGERLHTESGFPIDIVSRGGTGEVIDTINPL